MGVLNLKGLERCVCVYVYVYVRVCTCIFPLMYGWRKFSVEKIYDTYMLSLDSSSNIDSLSDCNCSSEKKAIKTFNDVLYG